MPRAINRASSCRTSAPASRQGPGSELAALFDAQILMLDDPMLIGRAEEIIRTERVNAAWAVHRAYEELYQMFSSMEDPYLRERENDVADVAGRLRMNLRHGAPRAPRAAQPDRRPVDADRRRADGLGRRAARLVARAGLCHRRRQPDVPHRDPRAIAEGAGDRRPARRVAAHRRRHAGDPRRHDRRAGRGAVARADRRSATPRHPAAPPRCVAQPTRARSPPPTACGFASKRTSSCSRTSST